MLVVVSSVPVSNVLLFRIKQFEVLHMKVCLGLKYQKVGKKGY